MWSGGLDSTWTLERFAYPVDVLSVSMYQNDVRSLRVEKERKAREALKPHLLDHRFHEVEVQGSPGALDDVSYVAFFAALRSKELSFTGQEVVLYGGNCSDDFIPNPEPVERQTAKVNAIFDAIYNGLPRPEYTWFKPEPSRTQQLKDLGSIADLTWSCRTPKLDQKSNSYVECGICLPCRSINKSVD